MGRPLRIKYSGATAVGVQEMSDADISDLILPLVVANWSGLVDTGPSGSVVRSYNTTPPSGYNFVSRGTGVNTETASIGTHPTTSYVATTYTIVQSEYNPGLSTTTGVRPIQQSLVGNEVKISSMSNQDIINDVMPVIVNSISTGGQGAYYLGLTSAGAPATGTWAAVSTLTDSYYNSSNVYQSISYTLWLRTSGGSVGTIRPLTITNTGGGETRLTEMTNSEIEQLASFVGEYIRTTGIGKYSFATTSPVGGTWVSRGSYNDTVNNLTNVPYTGYYTGQFTGMFTGNWTSAYTGYYTYEWTGYYQGSYTGVWTGYYTGTWNRVYTGYYQRTWTGYYQRQWTGVWGGAVAKTYTGNWAAGPVRFEYYTGSYVTTRNTTYTPNYAGVYVLYLGEQFYRRDTNWTGTWSRVRAGNAYDPYAGVYYPTTFAGSYTGTWAQVDYFSSLGSQFFVGYYSGTGAGGTNWTRAYSGLINKSRSAAFTSNIAKSYTGNYTRNYTRDRFVNYTRDNYQNYTRDNYQNFTGVWTVPYTGTWSRQWTGYYQRAYTGYYNFEYVGYYQREFSREFSGAYNGLTVQATTTTTTYYLWVRTA